MGGREPTVQVTRRHLLRAVCAAAGTAVAGCGGSDGDGPASTQSPTATPTDTSTATAPATPELPGIEKRVVQRDGPAIAQVHARVAGSITWPSLTVVDPSTVFGVWESRIERLTFRADGTFTLESESGSTDGTYAVRVNEVVLDPRSGEPVTYRYVRTEGESEQVLELYHDGELVARFTLASEVEGYAEPIDGIQALTLLPAEGEEATRQGGDVTSGATGSGFVVTPDGHVVTNAHVVLTDRDPERMLFERLAHTSAVALRESLKEEFAGFDLTDAEFREIEQVMYDKLIAYYLDRARIDDVTESVGVLNGRATPDDDLAVESWDATVERAGTVVTTVDGEQSWGRDVAVLSVDQSNLPSVTLGSAEGLETGDELFVIGYPDIGIDELFTDRSVALEPSLTTGVVSARRTLNSGVRSIQTDAAINHGNSGGPIYDGDGAVVGIATFGPADAGIEDVAFGLPIGVATGMLAELGVEPRSGEVDSAFDSGIEAYWRGDCETATDRMEAVMELYPDHPTAQRYVDDCESGDAPGS